MKKILDLSIFKKFNFDFKPVGVKFLLIKPDDIVCMEKKLAFCEMLKEAQNAAEPFYTTKENHECKVGPILLGMSDIDPIFESGQVGPKLGVYEEARANRKLYINIPKIGKGTVNYVAFSPIEKLNFDPDLLIITVKPSQAEVILRAYGYRSGASWNAKGTSVVGCGWGYTCIPI